MFKERIRQMSQQEQQVRDFCQQNYENSITHLKFQDLSDQLQCSAQIRLHKTVKDLQSTTNEKINLQEQFRVYSMNIKTHLDQFNLIYEAIESMSAIKKVQDKMDYVVRTTEKNSTACASQNEEYSRINRTLVDERDRYLK